jgi:hypothetical protein
MYRLRNGCFRQRRHDEGRTAHCGGNGKLSVASSHVRRYGDKIRQRQSRNPRPTGTGYHRYRIRQGWAVPAPEGGAMINLALRGLIAVALLGFLFTALGLISMGIQGGFDRQLPNVVVAEGVGPPVHMGKDQTRLPQGDPDRPATTVVAKASTTWGFDRQLPYVVLVERVGPLHMGKDQTRIPRGDPNRPATTVVAKASTTSPPVD